MEGEVLEVLREIRDEEKKPNVRLESIEGRVDFLEERTSKGFAVMNERLEESESRLATEVVALANVTREVRDRCLRVITE